MMKVLLTVVLFLFLVHGARAQELDLSDFFDKPNEPPKATEKPKNDESKKPAGGGGLLDLADALLPDNDEKNPVPPKSGGGLLDLADALLPDNDEKNPVPPKSGGGISDSDLIDVLDGYKPDGGSSGGRSAEGHVRDTRGGGDEKPQEAGSGQIAGIVSAVAMALVGAASSYIAYQKKKLCFKGQGGSDLERGKGQQGVQSEPQVLSNLLKTS
ncbi:CD99 molecule isoform X3 [Thalassophryne amazonica]|uniref:CD99 molecule isoform X3 n=1 Tax=Thalassophryne amazonica TaxID=390379 RepID=UPI0014717B4A|nr:CD99 molecule isoform X3 [Thalassophryne amazonica]